MAQALQQYYLSGQKALCEALMVSFLGGSERCSFPKSL